MEGSEPLDEPEDLSENDWNAHRHTQGSNLIGATQRVCADRMYRLEMTLQCGLCLELFTQPESLLCGHSFCAACIREQLSVKFSRCPTCHKSGTFDDLRPNDTLAATIETFKPARWSVLRVLDEHTAIARVATPPRDSIVDNSILKAGREGGSNAVNKECAITFTKSVSHPLLPVTTATEAAAAEADATISNMPVVSANHAAPNGTTAERDETLAAMFLGTVEETEILENAEVAVTAETENVTKEIESVDTTAPAETNAAMTVQEVEAQIKVEALTTNNIAPVNSLADSTINSKRISWSWPPGIRFNAEATARGFEKWHAPSPWRVLLSVHTNVPFFFNMETKKGQWEIPDGAYPRDSSIEVNEPNDTAVTAEAAAAAITLTAVAMEDIVHSDKRAAAADREANKVAATEDVMRSDYSATITDVAEKEAGDIAAAVAALMEGIAESDDGSTAIADATVEAAAAGNEINESNKWATGAEVDPLPTVTEEVVEPSRGALSENAAISTNTIRDIFNGDQVQVLGRHWPGMHKNGGMAIVTKVHSNGTLDVKLVVEGNTYRKLDPVFVVKGGDGNAPDLIDPPPSHTTTPSPAVATVDVDAPEITASTEAPPVVGKRASGSSQFISVRGGANRNTTEFAPALVPTPEEPTVLVDGADKGRVATSTGSKASVSHNSSSRTSHDASSLSSRSSPRRGSCGSNSSNSNSVADNNFWVCRRCTLQNTLGRTVCAACASRAPPHRSISPSSSKPSLGKRLRTNFTYEL